MMFCRNSIFAVAVLLLSTPVVAKTVPTGLGWKVGVIDSGIMEDHGTIISRTSDQACYLGRQRDITFFSKGAKYFNIAVACRHHHYSDFVSSDAAIVPRKVPHPIIREYEFGEPHGSNVSKIVRRNATGSRIVPVNISYFNSEHEYKDSHGSTYECGVHAYKNPLCYRLNSSERSVSWVATQTNMAAINMSYSSLTACNRHSSTFHAITKKKIALVAAAGNQGKKSPVTWPACNPNVISVGALKGGSIADYTSQIGRIDFFADGDSTHYKTGDEIQGTSFAAPRVAAAFAIIKEFNPGATVPEMHYALQYSASETIVHRYGTEDKRVPVVDIASARRAALCLRNKTCLRSNAIPGNINYFDGNRYGPAYGDSGTSRYSFTINFSQIANSNVSTSLNRLASQNVSISPFNTIYSNVRDVELRFTGKYLLTGHASPSNQWLIKVNGKTVIESNIFTPGERNFRFVINRNALSASGTNTIQVETKTRNNAWGIKEVKAEFIEPIPLTLNRRHDNAYGYDDATHHYTGLRATFELASIRSDYSLDVVGNDIDVADETAVFLNKKFIGHLSRSANNRDNAGNRFVLRQTDLSKGTNMIEFVQRRPSSSWNGYQDERWSVKRLLVRALVPNVRVTQFQLLNTVQRPNQPFNVSATVRNTGGSTTRKLDLNVYISNDANISTSDTRVGTQRLNGFAANASITQSFRIQSPLVSKNKYIGVCITNAPRISSGGGVGITTHCSSGTKFRNTVNIAPIIMLLLSDE